MGNCALPFDSDSVHVVQKSNFSVHYVIGKGGFGKVWRVTYKATRQVYAMKEMHKARIISKHSVTSVLNERKLLAVLKHPFIVNAQFAFQDEEYLYLIMDLMLGGDLRYHIARYRQFTEAQTKFFVCCVVTGLEYLHLNNVAHRDIKPENLVFDAKGYMRITDFGIAQVVRGESAVDTSGTPGYMAPEVICKQPHGKSVDYFAVGVIAYECMMGRRPYTGRNRKDIRDEMLARQVQLRKTDIPPGWSLDAADFINKLIQRKASTRLGFNGIHEVKNHAWLRNTQWTKLLEKTIESPFIPEEGDNFDARIGLQDWKDEDDIDTSQLRETGVQEMFGGYYFDVLRVASHKREEATTVPLPRKPNM